MLSDQLNYGGEKNWYRVFYNHGNVVGIWISGVGLMLVAWSMLIYDPPELSLLFKLVTDIVKLQS